MTRRSRKPAPAAPRLALTPEQAARLGHVSDRVLARQLGVDPRAVAKERKLRKIKPMSGGRRPVSGSPRTEGRTIWMTPEELAADDAARGDLPWAEWDRRARAAARGELDAYPCHGNRRRDTSFRT